MTSRQTLQYIPPSSSKINNNAKKGATLLCSQRSPGASDIKAVSAELARRYR